MLNLCGWNMLVDDIALPAGSAIGRELKIALFEIELGRIIEKGKSNSC